ncbi:MAG: FHA domain-containing protein [Ruminococcaceae bacterium]|nr:FHA domain-containing protein [Oscillospiraceae bacterium]
MVIKQCPNGHSYNGDEFAECPHCSGAREIGQTIPLGMNSNGNAQFSATEALRDVHTIPLNHQDMGVTQAPHNQFVTTFLDSKKNSEIKPVRGWLVVVEGDKLGMDFRIHTGKNTVGRSSKNDICINFDGGISSENSVSITYDDRNNMFFIQSGESKNNVYINNQLLLDSKQIKDNDIIEIGSTKLVFRALCNESFNY